MSSVFLSSEETHKLLYKGALTPEHIKTIFTVWCYTKGLYVPLRNFLQFLFVEFSERVPTFAVVKYPDDVRIHLYVNERFVRTHCENDSDILDCIMHEVCHPLFGHTKDDGIFEGYSVSTVNRATDALINAHLETVGRGGFFVKYYPDEAPYSFLRSGSKEFEMPVHSWFGQVMAYVRKKLGRSNCRPTSEHTDFSHFYYRLYAQRVILKEALEFFKQFERIPENPNVIPHCSHGYDSTTPKRGNAQNAESANKIDYEGPYASRTNRDKTEVGDDEDTQDSFFGHGRSENHFLNQDEIDALAKMLLVLRATEKVKNNFRRVIEQITFRAQAPGRYLDSRTYTQRMPARMSARDYMSVERGYYWFEKHIYYATEVFLFFDHSGSMTEYRSFLVDLARSLVRTGKQVRVLVWADGIQEISLSEFLLGKVPNVGSGTQGNVVADFLRKERVRQCVIVTDNMAGELSERVDTHILLALVRHGHPHGSFTDPTNVPNCEIFWLEPGDGNT